MLIHKAAKIFAVLITALICITSMITASSLPVTASSTLSDLQSKYNSLEQQQKKIKQDINTNLNDQQNTKAQQTELNQNISIVQQQVTILTQKISVLNSQIAQKQQQIDNIQKQMDTNIQLFKERLRAMYMDGNISFIEVLLSSKSLTDFLIKDEILQSISTHDTKLINNLANENTQINNEKKSLENDQNDLVTSNNIMAQKQNDLNNQISQANSLLGLQQKQAVDLTAKNKEIQKEMDAANAEIETLQSMGNYVGGDLVWPLQGITTMITSPFSWRTSPTTGAHEFHVGVDIVKSGGSTYGWPIRAANDGTISLAEYSSVSYGNHIIIDHGGGMMTLYGHCSSFASGIKAGVNVKKGEIIAYVGSTGNSTGPHLHFSVLVNHVYVNPLNYTFANQNCTNSTYYRNISPYFKSDPAH